VLENIEVEDRIKAIAPRKIRQCSMDDVTRSAQTESLNFGFEALAQSQVWFQANPSLDGIAAEERDIGSNTRANLQYVTSEKGNDEGRPVAFPYPSERKDLELTTDVREIRTHGEGGG
jgi:hypothetical protein